MRYFTVLILFFISSFFLYSQAGPGGCLTCPSGYSSQSAQNLLPLNMNINGVNVVVFISKDICCDANNNCVLLISIDKITSSIPLTDIQKEIADEIVSKSGLVTGDKDFEYFMNLPDCYTEIATGISPNIIYENTPCSTVSCCLNYVRGVQPTLGSAPIIDNYKNFACGNEAHETTNLGCEFDACYWSLTGNEIDDAINFIGTLNNQDFKIRTNNIERAVYTSDGKYGLNVMSPFFDFDIGFKDILNRYNRFSLSATTSSAGFNIHKVYGINGGNPTYYPWKFEVTTNSSLVNTGNKSAFAIFSSNATASLMGVEVYDPLFSIQSNGDIAIGNFKPKARLHVSESARIDGSLSIGLPYSDEPPTGFELAVNGAIITEELIVKLYTNWPDYIFNKNYNYLNINDTEDYIKKNNHLPEFKPAKEYEANGVNILETQISIIERLEILTLQVIELNNENKRLKNLIGDKNE